MRIVLATPLYPPDIAEPAPYIQGLAKRLAPDHEVTIVTYGRFVEPVEGVRIVAIDKRQPLPLRLARFTEALAREMRHADVLYLENGPSVELPGILVSLLSRAGVVLHLGDERAHAHAQSRFLLRLLERLARSRSRHVIDGSPESRPEIIPFLPRPIDQERSYDDSWDAHLKEVQEAIAL